MTEQKPKTRKAAAPKVEDRTDAAGTVSVACRLPAGLTVNVNGHGTLTFKGENDPSAIIVAEARGHHGITTGVPKDAWDALEIQYAGARWLKEGFVFMAIKSKDVITEARDLGERDAGFNQIDPETLGVENAPPVV